MLEVLRSGRLSLGPLLAEFERAFAARVGRAHASAVSSGTAGLHLALRAVGVSDGDEVVTSPFSFVASANVVVYERATAGVRRHRPGHAQPRSRRRGGRGHGAHGGAAAGAPVRLSRPTSAAFERLGLPIVEDACEALGAVDADGVPVGGRGHPAVFGFYANKQLTTGEGGMVTIADAAVKERIDSERNQGRAPDMDWLDHDRLGFNYRLSDIACALGLAQLERLDDAARRPGAGRVAYARRSARHRRLRAALPCSTPGGKSAAAGSCTSSSCRAASIATRSSARSPRVGSRASRTSPRST